MKEKQKVFFLHIKKCAGSSTKHLLESLDLYKVLDTQNKVPTFIQSSKEYWNDILNNSRVYLGDYNFKRSLFAKNYLFKEEWPNMFKFAFIRNPLDRIISCFFYLYNKENNFIFLEKGADASNFKILSLLLNKKLNINYLFDSFLDLVSYSFNNLNLPNKHFAAHVAEYSKDVCDDKDLLLDKLYDIDDYKNSILDLINHLEISNKNLKIENYFINRNNYQLFNLNKNQIKKIESLYPRDFHLYESLKYK